jgi:thioredoxin-like negative regulator of GroEL
MLKDGKEIDRSVGMQSEPALRDWFDILLEKYGN